MNENNTVITIYILVFVVVIVVAISLTLYRNHKNIKERALDHFVNIFLVGIAFQCLHFTEEFITRLYELLPQLLGLPVWSKEFFVTFNLSWIFIWILSAVGIKNNFRAAFIPLWFFAIMMIANGIIHPLLAVAVGGYFPGLITSPIVGILGILILNRLLKMTKQETGQPTR